MQSDCKVVAFIMRKNKEDKIMCKRVYLKAKGSRNGNAGSTECRGIHR